MIERITDELVALEQLLGYHFGNRALLEEAITTSSYAQEHPGTVQYEVLEFLGDRVVSLIIAERLCASGSLTEGKMTFLKAELEQNKQLAHFSEEIGLRRYIRAAEGRDAVSAKVLADVFEAICGAIYRDSSGSAGTTEVVKFLERFHVLERLEAGVAQEEDLLPVRNRFENAFRERYRCNPAIQFTYESQGAAHQKEWRITACAINNPETGKYVELAGVESGRWFGTKKDAETDALEQAYRWLEARGWNFKDEQKRCLRLALAE
jgi:dsRNA-specific ribonuclease